MGQQSKAAVFLGKERYDSFLWIQLKSLNPVQSFHRDSLLLITESQGVPGTHLIKLTMKKTTGFKSVNPGLVIGNLLTDSLLFHYNKAMHKILNI